MKTAIVVIALLLLSQIALAANVKNNLSGAAMIAMGIGDESSDFVARPGLQQGF